ncbi:snare protein syntaxin-like protein 18/UFE1 [Lentithecium fluviatile CBS 122367]|uniref:Snare protein syntaxin-like protein 18/UFE1 n=1 Tax=Lentithecium fluviatile CBS 122367 TaxID=1168545 RepID=A0A6G1J1U4_9PLEO|nr:snare protein syntaxin-like protein 18/UFE1 [Lentithecium fluviatile CBS 122367]
MDITPVFNEALAAHDALPVKGYEFRLQDLDEFVKEAYRIRSHITELHTYLRSIRQSYLSTAHPPRRKQASRVNGPNGLSADKDAKFLTDAQKNEVDASAKQLLRDLNFSITRLQDTEQIRQQAQSSIAYKKRAKRGLGALGRWAAGGAITAKSPEEEAEDAKINTIKAHRESIIWYLQRALEECGRFQSSMMEIRLTREVEKSKSVLYKARGTMPATTDFSGMNGTHSAEPDYRGKTTHIQEADAAATEQQLDPEQLQLFAQENQDMLKHYEDHLDQVRTAEKSLLEISELQTTLATNLSVQAEHIDQLVADSYLTTENVGSGNKELKRATERKSTAQLVFWSTCAFCGTLILWDLFI